MHLTCTNMPVSELENALDKVRTLEICLLSACPKVLLTLPEIRSEEAVSLSCCAAL